MNLKLIIALVSDEHTEKIIAKAREMGATGASVITSGRGEGLKPHKTFFGLTLEGQIDMVLFIVEKHLARTILEAIGKEGEFDGASGSGIAMQLNIEDAIGMQTQIKTLEDKVGEEI